MFDDAVSWAKAHPAAAAGIGVVGVLVVLYLLGYIGGGGSSSGAGSEAAAYYNAQAVTAQANAQTTIAQDQLDAQTAYFNDAVTTNAANNTSAATLANYNYLTTAENTNQWAQVQEEAINANAQIQEQGLNTIASNPNINPTNYSNFLGYQLNAAALNAGAGGQIGPFSSGEITVLPLSTLSNTGQLTTTGGNVIL